MKNLKYILFSILIFFMSLVTTKALSCTYSSGKVSFTCSINEQNINNNRVGCTFSDNNTDYKKMHIELTKSDFELSGKKYSYSCSQVPTIYVGMIEKSPKHSWKIFEINKSNNGCPIALQNYNSEYYNTNIDDVSDVSAPRGCTVFSLKNYNGGSNEGNNSGSNSGNNGSASGNNSGTSSNNNGGVTDLDLEHFCTGNILNVFKAVGYIFFAVKIIVPILLMIFGIIDFSKAIIISKDDEIKKAIKSIVIRAIASIIIFFVPSIINFAIELIGGEDVYRGSEFGACTECILDPNSNTCK